MLSIDEALGFLDLHRVRNFCGLLERIQSQITPESNLRGAQVLLTERCLILAFTNRSGSNYLAEHLYEMFEVELLGEALNEPALEKLLEGASSRNRRLARFPRTQKKRRPGFEYGVPLIKANPEQFVAIMALVNKGVIPEPLGVLHVRRRSSIDQAISLIKASATGAWTSEMEPRGNLPQPSEQAIVQLAKSINEQNWALHLTSLAAGVTYEEVCYERLLDGAETDLLKIGEVFSLRLRVNETVKRKLEIQRDEWNIHVRQRVLAELNQSMSQLFESFSESRNK